MRCKVCHCTQEKPPHYSFRQWKSRQFCSHICAGKALIVKRRLTHWKGGWSFSKSGYVYRYAPCHPSCTAKGYVMEHRLMMEQAVGRYLHQSEHVHHRNGLKADNRLENLELLDANEHNRRHALANGLGKDKKSYRVRDTAGRFR